MSWWKGTGVRSGFTVTPTCWQAGSIPGASKTGRQAPSSARDRGKYRIFRCRYCTASIGEISLTKGGRTSHAPKVGVVFWAGPCRAVETNSRRLLRNLPGLQRGDQPETDRRRALGAALHPMPGSCRSRWAGRRGRQRESRQCRVIQLPLSCLECGGQGRNRSLAAR